MTSPPPQNPWGARPGAPSPEKRGFGQPPQGRHYGPPPGQQQPWYPQPGPPKKSCGLKWVIFGGLALIAVIAVAVAVTVVVLHSDSGSGSNNSTSSSPGTV